MNALVSQPSAGPPANDASPLIVVKRVRFVDRASPGARVLRAFAQPRPCVAIEEDVTPGGFAAPDSSPEPTDHLEVILVLNGTAPEWQARGGEWLAPPDHPEAVPAVVVEREGYSVRWRPGRALVQGRGDCTEDVLAALTAFAFYEGELRTLEQELAAHEEGARADVTRAYRIRFRDRKHWDEFRQRIEQLSVMRLRYASLEPRLARPSRNLPAEARRVMARLLTRADVKTRMEALTNRLEVFEDLYEGASDRVADYRWYFGGEVMELGIILLLVFEVILMAADLTMHLPLYHAG
jgi:hypothetical protein